MQEAHARPMIQVRPWPVFDVVGPKAKYLPLSKWGKRPAVAAVPSQPTCYLSDCEVTVRSKSTPAAGFLEVTPSPTRGHRVRAPVASPDRSARPGSRGAPPRQDMARKIPPRPSALSPSELERQRRCLHKFGARMRSSQGVRRVKQTPGRGVRTWESRALTLPALLHFVSTL